MATFTTDSSSGNTDDHAGSKRDDSDDGNNGNDAWARFSQPPALPLAQVTRPM